MLSRTRILLVEDNRRMAEVVRAVLAGFGVGYLEHAPSAAAALEALQRVAFDLIVLDRRLGAVDGLDLARQIRRDGDPRRSETPILMLTGSASEDAVREARDAGVDSYLLKPFTVQALRERLVATLTQTRRFIRSASYIGPDRRRGGDLAYQGPERRTRRPAPGLSRGRVRGDRFPS